MRATTPFTRLLLLALVLMILLGTMALADTAEFTFTLNAAGDGYVVSGYAGSSTSVTVPDWYKQKPVTEIGSGAFQGKTFITSVSMPDTITRIGEAAFKNCTALSNVTSYAASAEPPASDRLSGDANDNGVVDIYDALLVMQYSAGWNVSLNVENGDVNASSSVDIDDALLILQYGAGLDVTLQ